MSKIDTTVLQQNLMSLERAYEAYQKAETEGPNNFEFYRNSLIKTFEYTLETCGKLLRKRLEPFFASKRAADALTFKEVFRKTHHRGLLQKEQTKRWECYRDKRNATSHEYGEMFTQGVLEVIEAFIQDVKYLQTVVEHE